jgi:phosphonate transport system substrate-binding protein
MNRSAPSPLHTTRRGALLVLAAAAGGAGAQGSPAPLNVALAPFLSPAALLAAFNPLRQHLALALARPVEMVTARDFRALMEATRRAEHDVVQLPAHLARLAMLDWGWRMLAAPAEAVPVIVAVKDRGPVRSIAELRGRSIAMLDPLSLTATVGQRWLELNGLAGSTTVQTLPSINSMLFALDRDEVAAFVAADTQLNSLPAATPRGERVLATVGGIPGPLFVARPTMPAPQLAVLRQAIESFTPDPTRPPTAANAPLRPLDEARLAALDGYVAIARRALGAQR